MGFRRRHKKAVKPSVTDAQEGDNQAVKIAKPVNSIKIPKIFRQIINNPNFNVQLITVALTLASENIPMDRHINTMTTTIDKIRNITEVVGNTMQSVKVAAEAPKQIRRLLE